LRVLAAPSASAMGLGAIARASAPISAAAISLVCLMDGFAYPLDFKT